MVKPIPYDTYPAMILFLALLGVYTKEISLVITAIGILVLHFIIEQWNMYESWTFLAAVVGWIVIWNSYYYIVAKPGRSAMEHFETVTTRPCNVYFTNFQQACDEGVFHKDLKYLKSLRDIKIGALEKDIQVREAELKKIDEAVDIVNAAIPTTKSRDPRLVIWNDRLRSITIYLTIRIDSLIQQEQSKGSEQDTSLIQSLNIQKRDIPKRVAEIRKYAEVDLIWFVNQRTWQINMNGYNNARLNRLNFKRSQLQKEIALRKTQIAAEKNSTTFINNDAIIKEMETGTTRCKNTYNGWFEPASTGNMNLSDPMKNTKSTETALRGNPYAWAHCYQTNRSMEDWSKKQTYFEANKLKYQDISYATIPVPVGDGFGSGSNAFTARFSFNRFSPDETMECDDNITTPDYPVIPNGLLEIKLDSADKIVSMRRIMYQGQETRFIDPTLTKNIRDVDNSLLRSIFYTDGIDFELTRPVNAPVTWTRTLKAFLFPNKNIRYDVYYLYYDKKCNRFYGNTTYAGTIRPGYLGPVKVGDLIGYSTTSTSVVPQKIYFPDAQITNPEVLDYIFRANIPGFSVYHWNRNLTYSVSSSGTNNYIKYLQDHVTNVMINTRLSSINIRINDFENKIAARDILIEDYKKRIAEKQAELTTLTEAGQCKIAPNNRWCTARKAEITSLTNTMNNLLNNTRDPNSRVNLVKSKDAAILEKDRIIRISNEIQRFINTVTNGSENRVSASQTLSSYIGRPITEFVKGYNESYLSNRRTMYLKITALVAGRSAAFLHDPTTDAFSKRLSLVQSPTLTDILDDDTTYEGDITFDESEFQEYNIRYEEEEEETTTTDPTIPPPPTTTTMVYPTVERFDVESPYTVKMYDIGGNLLKTYTLYNLRESIRNDPSVYKKVYALKINKGVSVTVYNGNNMSATYTNSNMATKPLDINLNSTMTGDRCIPSIKGCTNYLEQISIMQTN